MPMFGEQTNHALTCIHCCETLTASEMAPGLPGLAFHLHTSVELGSEMSLWYAISLCSTINLFSIKGEPWPFVFFALISVMIFLLPSLSVLVYTS